MALLALPLVNHFSVIDGWRLLHLMVLLPLVGGLICPLWRGFRPAALALLALLLASVVAALNDNPYQYLLAPLLINALLFGLFAQTLLPGRTPLINALQLQRHGTGLSPALRRYGRLLTAIWAAFFLLLLIEVLLLFWLAPPRLWSLFANGLNYLLAAGFFLGEFWLRPRLLPQVEHPGFFEYLRFLRRIDWRRMNGVSGLKAAG